MLEVKNVTVKYGSLTIIDDVSFTLGENQWLMIVGPNGAGKSTVINAISQGAPYTGTILFNGTDISQCKPSKLARNIGVLMQNHYVGYSFTVGEIVRLGRYAYSSGIFGSTSDEDDDLIKDALELTGMSKLADKSVLTLSGGELQRTFLAQLFAQNPQILLLDEPTNHLDLVYQKLVFGLIRDWIDRTGRSVISVVHDLSLARAYGTNAVLMDCGKIVASGTAEEVINQPHLNDVYAMDVGSWMRSMLAQWQ
ncbi:ABC transporter ATP-binding protein [Hydrogenoanaerobacterium sp.]|uniref:ABC transporter ATP-binding protein n=1 Tax=Hydrogenoanaerobacterium sp. TaxID=2953763 RepID=UPI00289E84A5|nr:ABC transporter ATP-binding protein [Hydrogenoanaerobacterium sp.]